MEIKIISEELENHATPALMVGIFEDQDLGKDFSNLDKKLNGVISSLKKNQEDDENSFDLDLLHCFDKLHCKKLLVLNLGKKEEFNLSKLQRAVAKGIKKLRSENFKEVSVYLHQVDFDESLENKTKTVVESCISALYEFDKYKSVQKEIKKIEKINILEPKVSKEIKAIVEKAEIIANNVNYVRDLVNEPSEIVTPEYLAQETKNIVDKNKNVKLTIMGLEEIQANGLGGLFSVGKGGNNDPRFIVVEYKMSKDKPIAFVGKGITFDSGGLNVKPAAYMENMRSDMAGAATVLGTLKTCIDLNIKQNLLFILPCCENSISDRSYRQGDVIHAYNGKTIEVWHTDAEGRLVLADGLSYAEKNFECQAIIDIATLTGAAIIALGYDITCLLGTDKEFNQKLTKAGKRTGELFWELPLHEDYDEQMKGDYGDLRNIAKDNMGPGTITAGLFLKNFVEKTPWIHLDIGGSGWSNSAKDYKPKGATGICLKSFIDLLENWK